MTAAALRSRPGSSGHSPLRLPTWTPSITAGLVVLALWWGVTATGWFSAQILVPPQAVAAAFVGLWRSGELFQHLGASLHRLLLGVSCGLGLGLTYGCALAMSRSLDDYTGPTFTVLRTVPSIAFIPVLILVFGIGETFKIIVIAKSTFFPVALATTQAVRGISTRYLDVARVYRLPRSHYVRRVILPAALPEIVTGMRLGIGRSWNVLVAAELVASERGLGEMMEFARQMFRLDIVMVGVVLTGTIGFALDRALRLLEAYMTSWKSVQ
jgi:sulfonate transport system permease protein